MQTWWHYYPPSFALICTVFVYMYVIGQGDLGKLVGNIVTTLSCGIMCRMRLDTAAIGSASWPGGSERHTKVTYGISLIEDIG